MNNGNPSAFRENGKEHFPKYTPGYITLPIMQLVLSLIIMGLTAYTLAFWPFVGNCLTMFTAVVTFITSIWLTVAFSCAPRAYNYWAVLSMYIFLYIFWVVSFGIMAADAAAYLVVDAATYDYCDDDYYSYYGVDCSSYNYGLSDADKTFGAIMAAASGLGALEFLLYFISLVIHSVAVFRHRRAGLHSRPICSISGGAAMVAPIQMHAQPNKQQYGPVAQQDNMGYAPQGPVYTPQQAYTPPPQGYSQQIQPPQGHAEMAPANQPGYYWQQQQQQPGQAPIMPQHTGASHHTGASPGPGQQAAYPPPQQHQPY